MTHFPFVLYARLVMRPFVRLVRRYPILLALVLVGLVCGSSLLLGIGAAGGDARVLGFGVAGVVKYGGALAWLGVQVWRGTWDDHCDRVLAVIDAM